MGPSWALNLPASKLSFDLLLQDSRMWVEGEGDPQLLSLHLGPTPTISLASIPVYCSLLGPLGLVLQVGLVWVSSTVLGFIYI